MATQNLTTRRRQRLGALDWLSLALFLSPLAIAAVLS